jgi:hypothetical protein
LLLSGSSPNQSWYFVSATCLVRAPDSAYSMSTMREPSSSRMTRPAPLFGSPVTPYSYVTSGVSPG